MRQASWDSPDIRIERRSPVRATTPDGERPAEWSVTVDGRELRRFACREQAEQFALEAVRAGVI
jgi:hypothetical protein